MKVENCQFTIEIYNPEETLYGGLTLSEDMWGINHMLPIDDIMQSTRESGYCPTVVHPRCVMYKFWAKHFSGFSNSFKISISRHSSIGEILEKLAYEQLSELNWYMPKDEDPPYVEVLSFSRRLHLSVNVPPEILISGLMKESEKSPVYGFNTQMI